MNSIQFLNIGTILTGALITGEALALLIGMHFLSGRGNPWISFKNDSLLGVDVVTGFGLILVVTMTRDAFSSGMFYLLALISILSHGFRGWEYLAGVQNRFCANVSLFVFNGLKMFGLMIVVAVGVLGR